MSLPFIIFRITATGSGFFLAGDGDHPSELDGTHDPRVARGFKSKIAALKVAEACAISQNSSIDKYQVLKRV
jgi:hypothetical protein